AAYAQVAWCAERLWASADARSLCNADRRVRPRHRGEGCRVSWQRMFGLFRGRGFWTVRLEIVQVIDPAHERLDRVLPAALQFAPKVFDFVDSQTTLVDQRVEPGQEHFKILDFACGSLKLPHAVKAIHRQAG